MKRNGFNRWELLVTKPTKSIQDKDVEFSSDIDSDSQSMLSDSD